MSTEDLFRAALRVSPGPMNLSAFEDGRLIEVNEPFCQLVGAPREELIGRTADEVRFWIDLADRERFKARLLADRSVHDMELQARTREGGAKTVLVSATLLAWNGELCILAVGKDVTQAREMETRLSQSLAEQAALLKGLPDLYFRHDVQGRCLEVHARDPHDLYLPPEQVLGRTIRDILPPAAAEPCMAAVEQAVHTKQMTIVEYSLPLKGGEQWFEARLLPISDREVVSVVRDTTEAKRLEQALREEEERFRRIFEDSPVGTALIAAASGRIVRVNRAVSDMLRIPAAELTCLSASEIIHPDDYPLAEQQVEALRSGRLEKSTFELRLVNKNKDVSWIKLTATLLRDRREGGEFLLVLIEDVTEHKWAQRLQAALYEVSETASSVRDSDEFHRAIHRIVAGLMDARNFYIALYNPDEALVSFPYFVDEHDPAPAPRRLGRGLTEYVLRTGQPLLATRADIHRLARQGEIELIGALGVAWLGIPLKVGDRVIGALVVQSYGEPAPFGEREMKLLTFVSQNIARALEQKLAAETLRRLEQEILQAQKLESLGVLAGGIAHDFNNILTTILGNISLARLDAPESERRADRLTEAEQGALRARELTQQLLTFSRGGAPVRRAASIGDLLVETVQFTLSGANVKSAFELTPDLWSVEVDQGQIGQVLNNLVINAIQAMPDGGRLAVRADNRVLGPADALPLPAGKYVRLTIEDTGVGIPPEHIGRVFDPYFTTKPKGSGLGLAIAYSIVTRHGGHIGVESEPGRGARFTIHLPASSQSLPAKSPAPELVVNGRGRILVMDDEASIRVVAQAMLRHLRYECDVAADGDELLQRHRAALATGRPYDLVIMDLTVPGGMGGEDAIKRLRQLDRSVKTIVSSGFSNDPVMAEHRRYSFDGVVAKPYRLTELSRVLQHVLEAGGTQPT